MTEEKKEKPLEVSLKAEDRELLKSVIKSQKPKEEKHEHTHFKADTKYLEQADSCPECKTGLEQFGKEYMKQTLLERKDLEFECEDCGTHVRREEENCPTCGGKNAKARR